MKDECDKIEECMESDVKALKFGVKGSKAERDLSNVKYSKKKAKVVKTKKKISPKLKLQLLKNYGFVVEDN